MVKLDIEIPTYCYDCPCHNGENGQCNLTGNYTFDKRPFDCPLKEEKHGHWIKAEQRGCVTYHESYAECSNCHGEPIQFSRSFKYCPHCGAKMDEKEEV